MYTSTYILRGVHTSTQNITFSRSQVLQYNGISCILAYEIFDPVPPAGCTCYDAHACVQLYTVIFFFLIVVYY